LWSVRWSVFLATYAAVIFITTSLIVRSYTSQFVLLLRHSILHLRPVSLVPHRGLLRFPAAVLAAFWSRRSCKAILLSNKRRRREAQCDSRNSTRICTEYFQTGRCWCECACPTKRWQTSRRLPKRQDQHCRPTGGVQ
jgi:hypothetical protein